MRPCSSMERATEPGAERGKFSLTLSRCGLLHGFNHYLAHGSEFDQHVAYALLGDERKELLRQDGKARIIQVAVPGDIALNRANRYLTVDERVARGEVPHLVDEFLKAWSYTLTHPDFDCGMGFCETVPFDWIVDIDTLPI